VNAATARAARRRASVRVEGTVQGVGFRPYVYRLASELGLDGFVLNDSRGVLIEVEGTPELVEEFLPRLAVEAPPLAKVERVTAAACEPTGAAGFTIRESPRDGIPDAPVAPDSATCADCLAELLDPSDRRFRYPFTNCTNCGPRFTIVRGVPYDRPFTTMSGFRMCELCQAEYDDPGDRRFHAQPNACPECGPSVSLIDAHGDPIGLGGARDGIAALASALRAGKIAAIKGIGGFHLACRADDEEAVALLRARKHREDKPRSCPPTSRRREHWWCWTPWPKGACWGLSARSCSHSGAPTLPWRRRLRRGHPSSGSCSPTRPCTTSCSPTPGSRW